MLPCACTHDSSACYEECSSSRRHYGSAAPDAGGFGSSGDRSFLRHRGCMGDRCAGFWGTIHAEAFGGGLNVIVFMRSRFECGVREVFAVEMALCFGGIVRWRVRESAACSSGVDEPSSR